MHEILDAVQKIGAKRLVIDSLAGFEMALAPGFRADFRRIALRMITPDCESGGDTNFVSPRGVFEGENGGEVFLNFFFLLPYFFFFCFFFLYPLQTPPH